MVGSNVASSVKVGRFRLKKVPIKADTVNDRHFGTVSNILLCNVILAVPIRWKTRSRYALGLSIIRRLLIRSITNRLGVWNVYLSSIGVGIGSFRGGW